MAVIRKLCLAGRSQAGKDESGQIINRLSHLRYGGSLSAIVAPLIAADLGVSVEQAWAERHQNWAYWFAWCDRYRQQDPARIIREAVRVCDLAIGVRSLSELRAAQQEHLIDLTVWIERAAVPPDPTLTFGPEDCDEVIGNNGTVEELEQFWRSWLPAHGIPLRAC